MICRVLAGLAACSCVLATLTHFVVLSRPSGDHQVHPTEKLLVVDGSNFEEWRRRGDTRSQRRHVWKVIAGLTKAASARGEPRFESWFGEDEAFSTISSEHTSRGIRGFSRESPASESAASGGALQSADAPLLTYTLYNDAAYKHIRRNQLYLRSGLERLRRNGSPDNAIADDRSVPTFPTDAVVVKTVWWPVAQGSITALPVWDPEHNSPRQGGNSYIGWQRIVAVDAGKNSELDSTAQIDFAGRSFPHAHRVSLDAFYHVLVDTRMAERTMRDSGARMAAAIALGRSLRAGDYLVLVGANLATRDIGDWVWAAIWWHDQPDQGPFAADRPSELTSAWRNYLLQVAFDSDIPAAVDGGPHICFNPWLEGRFPDGGHGGGTVSNCMTCHRRASYPPASFLPVTRGDPDLTKDPAYGAGRLRTSFLWSIALHARPGPP